MAKQTQKFIQRSVGLLVYAVAIMALFFSSCKKKEIPQPEITTPIYRVIFDSKDGTAVSAITVKSGDIITLPADPTKTGFIFDGWYTDKEASTTPFSVSTTIASNVILYAKWNAVAPAVFSLSSTSFTDVGEIPPKYVYQDNESGHAAHLNISPQLSWACAPTATTSYLIIMEETEIINQYAHWCVYNIPFDKTSLVENDSSIRTNSRYYEEPNAVIMPKAYQITIFALDLPANYFSDDNGNNPPPKFKAEAEQQLGNHILASAFIKGTFRESL